MLTHAAETRLACVRAPSTGCIATPDPTPMSLIHPSVGPAARRSHRSHPVSRRPSVSSASPSAPHTARTTATVKRCLRGQSPRSKGETLSIINLPSRPREAIDVTRREAQPPKLRLPRRLIRRGVVGVAATLLAAMATVGLASPAQAWSWSPVVDVIGFASCKTVPYALDTPAIATWVYVHSTGEIAEQQVNWVGYWDAHLKTIPPKGSWALVWIYCAVAGTAPKWRFTQEPVRQPSSDRHCQYASLDARLTAGSPSVIQSHD